MPNVSYQNSKLLLSLGVAAVVAAGCSADAPGNAEQPVGDVIEFQFRTVGTEYRGESFQHPDGKIESRPATPEKEAN